MATFPGRLQILNDHLKKRKDKVNDLTFKSDPSRNLWGLFPVMTSDGSPLGPHAMS